MTYLDSQFPEFDDRNLVLQSALGMLSLASRFGRIVERHAPARALPSRGPQTPEDEVLVDFALGILGLQSSLVAILGAPAPGTSATESPASQCAGGPDLLR